MMRWDTVSISTPQGDRQGIAPLVISASRETDLPAFHARWFMRRLEAGYCLWENPFNRTRQYVSFKNCRVFVFWSKNPRPLMQYLPRIAERGHQFYFQYTLNNYEREGLEPRVPPLRQRLATFKKLAERIGRHRVIWRFDPILLGDSLNVETLLERIARLAEVLSPHTEKLVFSFVDWYKKTANNLKKVDPTLRPPTEEERVRIAEGIVAVNNSLPRKLQLATCAENVSLAHLGIARNKCVDDALLFRLCPNDAELRRRYGSLTTQASLLPLADALKDSGQRKACGCVPSKDIGSYNTCMHLCAYCYANQSAKAARTRMNGLDVTREIL